MDSRDISLTAVFSALYVIFNIAQMFSVGNPLVSGPVQLRIADCLIALSALFGWPVAFGVTIGCVVSNVFSNLMYFLGPIDIILGPIANFIAASIIIWLRRHRLLACTVGALPIGLIVGGYLWLFVPSPDVLAFLPVWLGIIVSITISSLIAVAVIGYGLLAALTRPDVIESLKSRGLKILKEKPKPN